MQERAFSVVGPPDVEFPSQGGPLGFAFVRIVKDFRESCSSRLFNSQSYCVFVIKSFLGFNCFIFVFQIVLWFVSHLEQG